MSRCSTFPVYCQPPENQFCVIQLETLADIQPHSAHLHFVCAPLGLAPTHMAPHSLPFLWPVFALPVSYIKSFSLANGWDLSSLPGGLRPRHPPCLLHMVLDQCKTRKSVWQFCKTRAKNDKTVQNSEVQKMEIWFICPFPILSATGMRSSSLRSAVPTPHIPALCPVSMLSHHHHHHHRNYPLLVDGAHLPACFCLSAFQTTAINLPLTLVFPSAHFNLTVCPKPFRIRSWISLTG
jgi:hypothetical protein